MNTTQKKAALSPEELLRLYDRVGPFHEGLAWARKDGKWFHIRLDGTPAYKERYDYVGNFHEGLALVVKDGQHFYILSDGTRAE